MLPHQRDARTRMGLRTRHGSGGVVQHHQGNVMAVVHRISNTRHAAGEKGGIAHKRHGFAIRINCSDPLGNRDARAHAQARING